MSGRMLFRGKLTFLQSINVYYQILNKWMRTFLFVVKLVGFCNREKFWNRKNGNRVAKIRYFAEITVKFFTIFGKQFTYSVMGW